MFNIGPLELMVILVVALLVVGPKRLPEVGRSIGKGIREFRKAQDEVQRSLRLTLEEDGDAAPKRPARPRRTAGGHTVAPVASGNGSGANGDEAVGDATGDATGTVTATEANEEAPSGQDIARTIGRGLAELRKAREELQQSFRVDIDDPDARD
jgi:sec-independent protein translocase protein TatA